MNNLAFALGSMALAATAMSGISSAQTTVYTHDSWATDLGYGFNVCGIGDVDNDNVPDYLVSVLKGGGYVDVISGATGTLIEQLHTTGCFGMGLAALGDVTGDGVPDFAIGSPREDSTLAGTAGLVRIYSGADRSVFQTLEGDQTAARFGLALGNAGDVDGDGKDDIIVGSWWEDFGLVDQGSADVYSSATGLHLFQVRGTQTEQWFGTSVSGAGDVNNDGTPDVMVGAPYRWYNDLAFPTGTVQVFSGVDGSLLRTYQGSNNRDYFGTSIALLPDIDGDGVQDHAVGAPRHLTGHFETGAVHVFSGATGNLITLMTGEYGTRFGTRVASGDDLDNDGVYELLISACACVNVGPITAQPGSLHVRNALNGAELAVIQGRPSVGFAYSVASVGDLDGDGKGEILFGTHWDNALGQQTGSATVASIDDLRMASSEHLLPLAAGGIVDLDLDFGPGMAGMAYFVVGGASGTSPGFDVDGIHFNLNYDSYTALTVSAPNTHELVGTFGLLSPTGRAAAKVQTGPGMLPPALAGINVWYTTAVFDNGTVVAGSNSVPVTLMP